MCFGVSNGKLLIIDKKRKYIIKELESTVKELNSKTTNAEKSVKDIAIKAIESSAKLKIIESETKSDKD